MMLLRIFLLFLLTFLPVGAFALELGMPVGCEIGKDCFVQNYVDTAPGEDYADFHCQKHTYDKHDGIDIRLRNYVEMQKGVAVIAAADGTVIGMRDGMEDINLNRIDPATIKDRECGNGVVLDHGNGWHTQYCHMRKGSVRVKKGDHVGQGTMLGFIGLSGKTEFPHVHFEVTKDNKKLDPFTGKELETPCDSIEPVAPLWSKEAQSKFPYLETALLGAGFATEKPEPEDIRSGKGIAETATPESPALILWADFMGLHKEDTILMVLTDPDGHVLSTYQKDMDHTKATYFLFSGKTNANIGKWTEGIYQGKVSLLRRNGDKNIAVAEQTVEIYVR